MQSIYKKLFINSKMSLILLLLIYLNILIFFNIQKDRVDDQVVPEY